MNTQTKTSPQDPSAIEALGRVRADNAARRFAEWGSSFDKSDFEYLKTIGWRDLAEDSGQSIGEFYDKMLSTTGVTGVRWGMVQRERPTPIKVFCSHQGFFIFDDSGEPKMAWMGIDHDDTLEVLYAVGLRAAGRIVEHMIRGPFKPMVGHYFANLREVNGGKLASTDV